MPEDSTNEGLIWAVRVVAVGSLEAFVGTELDQSGSWRLIGRCLGQESRDYTGRPAPHSLHPGARCLHHQCWFLDLFHPPFQNMLLEITIFFMGLAYNMH